MLVLRGREPAKGTWGIPGGLLELGETLAAGVKREVLEECGVQIEAGPLVGIFEPMERDEAGRLRFHYVVIDLLARYLSGEVRADDDADDARWIDLDDLDSLPILPDTKAMIQKALALKGAASSG